MTVDTANIPMKTIGPIKITGCCVNEDVNVPLATFETPLWPSVNRGARVSREAGGINAIIVDDRMSRSVVMQAPNATEAVRVNSDLLFRKEDMIAEVEKTSKFAKFSDIHTQIVGNLLYLRFECTTGDASGHNMITKVADHLMNWILAEYPKLKYVSVSGNVCTDKKVSAVNGILGRGKYVVADIVIPKSVCEKTLKTTPEKIADLNIKKNLIGSTLAGSLRSSNSHFANMLLAFYLATGQDAANIVEGSQGIVHTEKQGEDLYFSVTLPNIIVGTVGNGKTLGFVQDNLKKLGCASEKNAGENAKRLAIIAAATVLCGELSLLAAQTNPGELMRSHLILERKKQKLT